MTNSPPVLTVSATAPRNPLDWLDAPSPDRGIGYLQDDGRWRRHTYDELASRADAVAAEVGELAGGEERVVPIVLQAGPDFIAAFFGVLRAGCTPCPLAPPTLFQRRGSYVDHLAAVFAVADPLAVLSESELSDDVAAAARRGGLERPVMQVGPHDGRGRGRSGRRPEIGLLQFTSGSTGRPRGVRVGIDNLEANLAMISSWAEMRTGDTVASWLPVYHDMGLIGTTLVPVTLGLDVLTMLPEQFVMEPLRWIECFGSHGGTVTASPSFGYGYAAKRLRPEDLRGLDLSAWRIAIAGAERLDAGALSRFARLAASAGFPPESLVPAYGMAEATLAITGVPASEVPAVVKLDWSTIGLGRSVRVLDSARIDDVERIGDGVGWVVDCGAPMAGVSVEVVDGRGDPLPDGTLGEVVVHGPSVAKGYSDDGRAGASRFAGGSVRTGDAAFVRGERLFVLGRIADAVSLRGRNVYAEDLEAAIASIDGVSRGRCAVFTGMEADAPAIVAVVEAEHGDWTRRVGRLLSKTARDDAKVYVLRAGRGTIARTSSGKPRRRAMFESFLEGRIEAELVWGDRTAPPPLEPAARS